MINNAQTGGMRDVRTGATLTGSYRGEEVLAFDYSWWHSTWLTRPKGGMAGAPQNQDVESLFRGAVLRLDTLEALRPRRDAHAELWPALTVRPNTLSQRILDVIGSRDAQTGDAKFDSAFEVRCSDRDLIVAVLNRAVREWLASRQSTAVLITGAQLVMLAPESAGDLAVVVQDAVALKSLLMREPGPAPRDEAGFAVVVSSPRTRRPRVLLLLPIAAAVGALVVSLPMLGSQYALGVIFNPLAAFGVTYSAISWLGRELWPRLSPRLRRR